MATPFVCRSPWWICPAPRAALPGARSMPLWRPWPLAPPATSRTVASSWQCPKPAATEMWPSGGDVLRCGKSRTYTQTHDHTHNIYIIYIYNIHIIYIFFMHDFAFAFFRAQGFATCGFPALPWRSSSGGGALASLRSGRPLRTSRAP